MNRRLLGLCAALALGEGLGFSHPVLAPLFPVPAFAALVTALIGFGLRLRVWPFVTALLAGLALSFGTVRREARTLSCASGHPLTADVTVAGDVLSRPSAQGSVWHSFRARIGRVTVRVVLPTEGNAAVPRPGEGWRVTGWLSRREETVPTLWVKGAGTSAVRLKAPSCAARLLAAARVSLSRRLGIGLDGRSEGVRLNRAILLGERARLARRTREAFAAAGTLHVFAISGLHVMAVAHLLGAFLLLTGIPWRLSGLVLLPILWAYVALVGMGPSAVRAAAMASVCHLAPVFWRKPDMLSAWCAVFLACHVLDPRLVTEVGSLLSFTVMLGILLWIRYAAAFGRPWLTAAGVTVAAWAAGVPIAARVFEQVTPAGLLANCLLIPLAGVAVGAGALALPASLVSQTAAGFLNGTAALASETMAGLSVLASRLPGGSFAVRPWTLWECFAWYGVIVLVLLLIRLRHRPGRIAATPARARQGFALRVKDHCCGIIFRKEHLHE